MASRSASDVLPTPIGPSMAMYWNDMTTEADVSARNRPGSRERRAACYHPRLLMPAMPMHDAQRRHAPRSRCARRCEHWRWARGIAALCTVAERLRVGARRASGAGSRRRRPCPVTWQQKIAWIVRLEDQRLLRDPNPPPPVVLRPATATAPPLARTAAAV